MLVKVSELTGVALDWAVAKCEGFTAEYEADIGDFWIERTNHNYTWLAPFGYLKDTLRFSTDWSQGGPIIEREMIQLTPHCMVNPLHGWAAAFRSFDEDDDVFALHRMRGKTPLIAAMRCFVESKLGSNIEVPDNLK
jgi:hypothetical protein